MKDNNLKIEQRMKNMKDFYVKTGNLIDKLPEAVPEDTRNMLKKVILGDKELKQLMDGIEAHRPPRIFMIGRTGMGKSSLINALCGSYVAKVSDTKSCTKGMDMYKCMDGDRVLMEICDTRGFAESEALDGEKSAEKMLIEQISEFSPDVVIFVLNCTHKDDVGSDVQFLRKLSKDYEDRNSLRLPIVCVVNKCDEMALSRLKRPSEYTESKKEKINEVVQYYKEIIVKNGLKIDNILPVSSLVDWMTPDGVEVPVEAIENLPQYDIDNLQMAFDGRYNIEELLNILEEAILDFEAQMGLRMAARLNDVVHRLGSHLVKIFSGISATVALTPIPLADIYVLVAIQSFMVCLIASLSGREISLETAKEFIFSMGGIVGAGNVFRLIAQQGTKLLNGLWPGAGSAVSASVAAFGTGAIGKAAIAYYIDDFTIEGARKKFDEAKKEKRLKNEEPERLETVKELEQH